MSPRSIATRDPAAGRTLEIAMDQGPISEIRSGLNAETTGEVPTCPPMGKTASEDGIAAGLRAAPDLLRLHQAPGNRRPVIGEVLVQSAELS